LLQETAARSHNKMRQLCPVCEKGALLGGTKLPATL
jgi:hypothetical protein